MSGRPSRIAYDRPGQLVCRWYAAPMPEIPAPTTTTSKSSMPSVYYAAPMAGRQLELMPGETMVLSAHPHWWFFWKEVAAAVGVLLLIWLWVMWDGALGTIAGWLVMLAVIVLVIDTIVRFFQWQTTRFAITDQRVAYQSGFFH